MNKEAIEIRKAYYRQWRAKNKEKIKKYNKQYWEKRAKRNAPLEN